MVIGTTHARVNIKKKKLAIFHHRCLIKAPNSTELMKSRIKPTKASYPSEGKPERIEESFLPKTQMNKSVESTVHLNCLFGEPN